MRLGFIYLEWLFVQAHTATLKIYLYGNCLHDLILQGYYMDFADIAICSRD